MRRLIIFIIIIVLLLAFIILNIDNKCDISLGFRAFKEIPIFITAFFSFLLGLLFSIPLAFSLGRNRKNASHNTKEKKNRKGKKNKNNQQDTDSEGNDGSSGTDYSAKENSYYGID